MLLQYPYGHPLGAPGNLAQQDQIFWDALNLLNDAEEPTLLESPYRWRRTKFPLEKTHETL
ncbi:MAG: hypothetical protein RRB13_15570 [bacterium]|nr:hypothetical protein [bacterium]